MRYVTLYSLEINGIVKRKKTAHFRVFETNMKKMGS